MGASMCMSQNGMTRTRWSCWMARHRARSHRQNRAPGRRADAHLWQTAAGDRWASTRARCAKRQPEGHPLSAHAGRRRHHSQQLAHAGRHVVVVGSGFIGLETAANALFRHAQVTVVEPQDRPWPSMLPPALSQYIATQYIRRGAALHYKHSVIGFTAGDDGQVTAVQVTPWIAAARPRR